MIHERDGQSVGKLLAIARSLGAIDDKSVEDRKRYLDLLKELGVNGLNTTEDGCVEMVFEGFGGKRFNIVFEEKEQGIALKCKLAGPPTNETIRGKKPRTTMSIVIEKLSSFNLGLQSISFKGLDPNNGPIEFVVEYTQLQHKIKVKTPGLEVAHSVLSSIDS